jgi:outer membrane protein TolC
MHAPFMKSPYLIIVAVLSAWTFTPVLIAQDEAPPLHQASLVDLVSHALQHNIAIRQAKEEILEQEGLILEVKAQVLPNAALTAAYSTKDDALLSMPASPGSGAEDQWNLGVEVTQLLYSGGGVSAALDAQKYARESVSHGLRATVDDALLDVRRNYYDVLLTRDQIEVEEQNIQYLEAQLQNVKNRFSANTVSRFDVLQAEVELANAQPALIRARNNYRIAIDELYRSIGYQSRRIHAYDGSEVQGELSIEPIAFDLDQALGKALEERPELARLKAMQAAREAGVRVAKAGYFPTVQVYAGYELEKHPMSDAFGDSMDGWKVGVRSSWALFDGRKTEGKMIQARSQARQAGIAIENLKLAIEVEVRRAISALQEAGELSDAAGKVLEQAAEALRLAEVRYAAGSATQLELLQSRVALTQARTNQLVAHHAYLVSVARLRKAIGESQSSI